MEVRRNVENGLQSVGVVVCILRASKVTWTQPSAMRVRYSAVKGPRYDKVPDATTTSPKCSMHNAISMLHARTGCPRHTTPGRHERWSVGRDEQVFCGTGGTLATWLSVDNPVQRPRFKRRSEPSTKASKQKILL